MYIHNHPLFFEQAICVIMGSDVHVNLLIINLRQALLQLAGTITINK